MLLFTLVIIFLIAVTQSILLYMATKKLLQFDDVFAGIYPELLKYSQDLKRMASGDLNGIMVDHPEIAAFHKRNMTALKTVESIVDSVTKMMPRRPKLPELPRPDME